MLKNKIERLFIYEIDVIMALKYLNDLVTAELRTQDRRNGC